MNCCYLSTTVYEKNVSYHMILAYNVLNASKLTYIPAVN